MRSKIKKKVKIIIFIIIALFVIIGLYCGLIVRNYVIETDKINNPVRIALITDLHSCKYGEKQQNLINEIDVQKPDVIMMSGDIFDDKVEDTNSEYFIQGISGKYPCYYVAGNHEYWSGLENFNIKMDILKKYNINILSAELETININGETINICGVDDPDGYTVIDNSEIFNKQLDIVGELADKNNYYTILLSHRPEFFELYTEYNFDLVLSGHAHGGQWRIPYILNGLYAPNQGLFPKYAGGEYTENDTTMIVSRGLARESTLVPRFYNCPELVIIDLI